MGCCARLGIDPEGLAAGCGITKETGADERVPVAALGRTLERLEDDPHDVRARVIARALRTSVRSLQRRLTDRKVALSSLVDDARRDRARVLMQHEGILLADAASELGLTTAGLHRAFRRWTGMTPREFQRARGERPKKGR